MNTIVTRLREDLIVKLKDIDSDPNVAIEKLLNESTNRLLIERYQEDQRIREISTEIATSVMNKIISESQMGYR